MEYGAHNRLNYRQPERYKRCDIISRILCANGNPQRQWINRDHVSSPTVSTEATMLTSVIEAKEERDVASCDIPNAFIQTELEEAAEVRSFLVLFSRLFKLMLR